MARKYGEKIATGNISIVCRADFWQFACKAMWSNGLLTRPTVHMIGVAIGTAIP